VTVRMLYLMFVRLACGVAAVDTGIALQPRTPDSTIETANDLHFYLSSRSVYGAGRRGRGHCAVGAGLPDVNS
jgi:hypothetical protein